MATWTAAHPGAVCGYDGKPIEPGAPMQVFTFGVNETKKRYRCEEHAHGEVDWAAVRAALVVQEARAGAKAADASVARSTRVLPASAVEDLPDPKLAAAGED